MKEKFLLRMKELRESLDLLEEKDYCFPSFYDEEVYENCKPLLTSKYDFLVFPCANGISLETDLKKNMVAVKVFPCKNKVKAYILGSSDDNLVLDFSFSSSVYWNILKSILGKL